MKIYEILAYTIIFVHQKLGQAIKDSYLSSRTVTALKYRRERVV